MSLDSIDFYLEFRFYWFLPDQLILTFGSHTHSGLSSQKKRIPTETDTIKFQICSIDFYLEVSIQILLFFAKLILTIGSKTHSGLLTEKKDGISTETDTIKFQIVQIFIWNLYFIVFLPVQLCSLQLHSNLQFDSLRVGLAYFLLAQNFFVVFSDDLFSHHKVLHFFFKLVLDLYFSIMHCAAMRSFHS